MNTDKAIVTKMQEKYQNGVLFAEDIKVKLIRDDGGGVERMLSNTLEKKCSLKIPRNEN